MKNTSVFEKTMLIVLFAFLTSGALIIVTEYLFYNFILMFFAGFIIGYFLESNKNQLLLISFVYLSFIILLKLVFKLGVFQALVHSMQYSMILTVIILLGLISGLSLGYLTKRRKRKMRRTKIIYKIIAILLFISSTGFVLFISNAFLGNPVSYFLAKQSTQKYIEEKFSDKNLEIDSIYHDFKSNGGYGARVVSKTSIDTKFTVYLNSFGKVHRDDYSNQVKNMTTTFRRVSREYRELVKEKNEKYKVNSDLSYSIEASGEILAYYSKSDEFNIDEKHGFEKELVLDKIYDLKEVGSKYGKISIRIIGDIASVKESAEILLDFKKHLDNNQVKFKYFNLLVRRKAKDDEKDYQIKPILRIVNFKYSDLVENNLVDKLIKADLDLKEYYKKMDEKYK